MTERDHDPDRRLAELVKGALGELARRFPVSCWSDEFFYFPQALAPEPDWSAWDDFSPDSALDIITRLQRAAHELDALSPRLTQAGRLDADLASSRFRALAEQLEMVRDHERKPTLHLTIAGIGLAQAIEQGDDRAFDLRAAGLPAFLDRRATGLSAVPELFRDLALQMVPDTRSFLADLDRERGGLTAALQALERFEQTLRATPGLPSFTLPPEVFAAVVRDHLGAGPSVDQVRTEIDAAVDELHALLAREAAAVSPGSSWPEAVARAPEPSLPADGELGLYRGVVEDLARHCRDRGLVTEDLTRSQPVTVRPIPGHLRAVRSASAYSLAPGSPPRGGTFFVIGADDPAGAIREGLAEHRHLAAHETWPGHHLLDIIRWSEVRPLRRPFEQPLFYEGWASFAEELMVETGFLDQPHDRLLSFKRRLWRALRGRVDLGLQTGALDVAGAAAVLAETGMSRDRAVISARRYALNPGYQLCYTVGRNRFAELDGLRNSGEVASFTRAVLSEGEIDLGPLAGLLRGTGADQVNATGE